MLGLSNSTEYLYLVKIYEKKKKKKISIIVLGKHFSVNAQITKINMPK